MKIFLSYSWKNSNIAEKLDILFQTKNIVLERDVRDVEYRQSIKEFMKRVRKSDYCLVVISESYLKSIKCMYEVTEFIKDENYIQRILPLIQRDTDIFSVMGRNKYIKYWQDKYKEIEASSSGLDKINSVEAIKELKRIESIQRNIGEFMSIISDMKSIVFNDEIDQTDFNKIYSVINPNDCLLGEYKDIDGYFVLNVPRTILYKVFTWWEKESRGGYTEELNSAKVFTKSEIDKKMKGHPKEVKWWCKKFAAIPINELAVKLGQNYVPYNYHFLKILRENKKCIIGNSDIYLSDEEIKIYG